MLPSRVVSRLALTHILRHNSHAVLAIKPPHNHSAALCQKKCIGSATAIKSAAVFQYQPCQQFSGQTEATDSSLDSVTYDRVCSETLDALSDYFDELTENATDLSGSDVAYSDGVLTVNLGQAHGTYVINRQTPNKQIWLSSPTSGPKRFDFVGAGSGSENGKWIYKHSGESLHQLLQSEIAEIIRAQPVDFMRLPHCS